MSGACQLFVQHHEHAEELKMAEIVAHHAGLSLLHSGPVNHVFVIPDEKPAGVIGIGWEVKKHVSMVE